MDRGVLWLWAPAFAGEEMGSLEGPKEPSTPTP